MIIFDLDGTLALDHHRSHFLKGDKKYWDEYFNACSHDELNEPIYETLRCLAERHNVAIWTGRSDKVKDLTLEWLKQKDILHIIHHIRMRPEADRTQDDVMKIQWMYEHNEMYSYDPVTLVFEDRQRVVDAWRKEGITCCQVAPGAF